MDTTLLAPMEWARTEFSACDLGNQGSENRLPLVATRLAENPSGTLPAAFKIPAELKAAYRLFGREETTYADITAPHFARVRERCRAPGEYLLVEDTTELDYTAHPATTGLGRIGDDNGRGLFLHTMLALQIARWTEDQAPAVTVAGLFHQHWWARTEPPIGSSREKKADRYARSRESERWAAVADQVDPPPPGTSWTFVGDRDSDIWEVFTRCRDHGWHFIIRANQARALDDLPGSIFTAVAAGRSLGEYPVDLRARPGKPARKAVLAVRFAEVSVRAPWRPGGQGGARALTVVETQEVNVPEGIDPVHWVLLTDWPCTTFEDARRVIGAYTRRWLVEEYHKALKSGTSVEKSQLKTAARITALLGIYAVVAARLLDLKLLAGTLPDEPVDAVWLSPDMVIILEAMYGRPPNGWTNRTLLVAIAKAGGFMGRKGDGTPGWLIIWRGWNKLILLMEGYHLAVREKNG